MTSAKGQLGPRSPLMSLTFGGVPQSHSPHPLVPSLGIKINRDYEFVLVGVVVPQSGKLEAL